jgi:predicted ATPase
MMTETKNDPPLALSDIHVEGFKSLRDRVHVDLRRLTVLAGANS